MASSERWTGMIPLVLRLIHIVLHLGTCILIAIGLIKQPELPPGREAHRHLYIIRDRTLVWLVFEVVFLILASVMVASSVVSLKVKNPPRAICRFQEWCLENFPNFTFFYYVFASLFVLYGAMIGCNIPHLFHRVFSSNKDELVHSWQIILICGIIAGVTNSILYFVAAFFPLDSAATGRSTLKAEETLQESAVQAPMENDKNQAQELNNKGDLAEKQVDAEKVESEKSVVSG